MVTKIEGYKAHDGRIFLSEEAAVRHESLERLCEIIPEFQMIRPRLEAQLDAVATAMGPMLDFRRRVPSPGPIVDPSACTCQRYPTHCANDCPLHGLEEEDHGELAGTCDCSAGMNGASDHARSCPSYRPVAVKLAHG